MASKAIAPRADYLGYGLGAIMAFVLAFVVLSAGEKNQNRRPVIREQINERVLANVGKCALWSIQKARYSKFF